MNAALLHLINGLAGKSSALDDVMIVFAKYLIFVAAATVAVCCVLLIRTRAWRSLAYVLAGVAAAFLLLQLAGTWHPDHRPFMDYHLTQLVAHEPGSSFPSDHTTAAAAGAFSLLFFTRFVRTGWAVFVMALLIGFARVFVGIHYPLDILGAFLTALAGSLLVLAVRTVAERRMRVPAAHG